MDSNDNFYPDFDHPTSQLSAFDFCIDMFIISLKDGKIVHFTPDNFKAFRDWLTANGVRDIREDLAKLAEPPKEASPKWYIRLINKIRVK
jgi:hypothetical protein